MKLKYFFLSLILLPLLANANGLKLITLDNQQLTRLFKGYTFTVGPVAMLRHVYIDNPIKMYFSPDGKLSAKWNKPLPNTQQTDTGIWWVKNNEICVKWKTWGNSCAKFYPLYDNYIIIDQDPGHEALLVPKKNFTAGNLIPEVKL